MKNIAVKILGCILIFIALSYAGLSLYFGEILSPTKFKKFAIVIGRATLLDWDGLKVAQIVKKTNLDSGLEKVATFSPLDKYDRPVNYSSYLYVIPLPKYSILYAEDNNKKTYRAVLSHSELMDYFNKDLAVAGWKQGEQYGSLYTFVGNFEGHYATLHIIKNIELTYIAKMSFYVVENNDK